MEATDLRQLRSLLNDCTGKGSIKTKKRAKREKGLGVREKLIRRGRRGGIGADGRGEIVFSSSESNPRAPEVLTKY